jgi:aryl-alcohol dehydrogenase-like predicted oxidoreductase
VQKSAQLWVARLGLSIRFALAAVFAIVSDANREEFMQKRTLGRTGLEVSVLGFGCGAVGGLMVRASPADQERTVARALELGINYFDTAPSYGDGASERNLGRVLAVLKPNIIVGTKVRIAEEQKGGIARAIEAGMDESLRRLGRDHVDLFQLHNAITAEGRGTSLSVRQVREEVVPAFERLRQQGKTRFIGITAIGETPALHEVVGSRTIDTAQVVHNMLNPTAGMAVPAGYPAQDYARLLDATRTAGVGTIGIRVLAGGALSGSDERHPIASPPPDPIGSANNYAADVGRAQRLQPLVDEGHAASLVEAALRFAIVHPGLSTTLIGIATPEQFETAAQAMLKGPMPPAALTRLAALQAGFVGESR